MSGDLSASWAGLAAHGLVHGSLAFALIWVLWWPLRRRAPAQLACVLFSLALLKLALPVSLPAPRWLTPLAMDRWLPASSPPAEVVFVLDASATSPDASAGDGAASAADDVAPSRTSLVDLAFAGWVFGVLFLGLRFLRNEVRTWRAVRAARPLADTELGLSLDALRTKAGVRRRVRWLASDRVATPAAGGLLRPYVLVPPGLAEHLPGRQLAFVLLHELAHIRRGDLAVAAVQRVVQILWFFHPAVWLASRLVEQHRELACDQDALARSGASRRECGEAFLSVVAWVNGREVEPTATLAMFDPNRVLKRRLMQILTAARPGHASRWLGAVYFALAAAVTLPSAKANAPTALDMPELIAQDDGQREQVEQLKKALAELRKQQAELSRQIERLQDGKAKGAARAERDDDEDEGDDHAKGAAKRKAGAFFVADPDDDEVRVYRAGKLLPGARIIRTRDGKAEVVERKAKDEAGAKSDKGAARSFAWRDGKLEGVEGGTFTFGFDGEGKGAWKPLKDAKGAWTFKTGDGEAKVFSLGGEDGNVFWVDTDGKLKKVGGKGKVEGLPGGRILMPRFKLEQVHDGTFRVEVDHDDDGAKSKESSKSDAKPKKVRRLVRTTNAEELEATQESPEVQVIEGQPGTWRFLPEGQSRTLQPVYRWVQDAARSQSV